MYNGISYAGKAAFLYWLIPWPQWDCSLVQLMACRLFGRRHNTSSRECVWKGRLQNASYTFVICHLSSRIKDIHCSANLWNIWQYISSCVLPACLHHVTLRLRSLGSHIQSDAVTVVQLHLSRTFQSILITNYFLDQIGIDYVNPEIRTASVATHVSAWNLFQWNELYFSAPNYRHFYSKPKWHFPEL